jgi:cell division protein ZapA (FtsZ GTPase activity inhibitor)
LEQLVTIELFGQPYTFKTESDVIKAKEVAEYLVEEVARIETQHAKTSSNVTKLTTMILAALNIANENMELKKNHSELLENISRRSSSLISELDAAVNIDTVKQVGAKNP